MRSRAALAAALAACARGHFHKYRAQIKLSSAHYCRKDRVTQFRRLRLTWIGTTPPDAPRTFSDPIACPSTLQPLGAIVRPS